MNDTKAPYNRSPLDIALGVLKLASIVKSSTGAFTIYPPPEVLIVAPPLDKIAPIDWFQALFDEESVRKSKALAGVLGPMATAAGFPFFDAGAVISTGGLDGVHFTEENHDALGVAICQKVAKLLTR